LESAGSLGHRCDLGHWWRARDRATNGALIELDDDATTNSGIIARAVGRSVRRSEHGESRMDRRGTGPSSDIDDNVCTSGE
jgi:hypothetical protein